MIYTIYSIALILFIIISFRIYKFLLKATDIMKYMFYILLYIVGILIVFQGMEKLITLFYKQVSPEETNFMFLVYLLATMVGFLSVAIITVKKLKKK
ncbi:MAG: hypothetical protein LBP34_07350 [Flavobacteriaceae bacterium]|jgi:hypothetical protein|nr:hypothetical protein [Flavobacteriaceae bacterium]